MRPQAVLFDSDEGGSSSRKGPSAVLFDLDGTLVDSRDAIWDALSHAATARRHPLPARAEVEALVGFPLEALFASTMRGVDAREASALVAAYHARFAAAAPALLAPMPGAFAALEALRGTPLAVVTTKRRAAAEITLAAVGMRARFAAVVPREDASALKPDPAPVREACARLAVAPERAVMVGDTPLDVRAAKAAGARAIGVAGGHASPRELRAAGAERVLASLNELRAALAW